MQQPVPRPKQELAKDRTRSLVLLIGGSVGAVVLFGKRMGIDGEWIKIVGAAGVAVLTAAGFFSNQTRGGDDA